MTRKPSRRSSWVSHLPTQVMVPISVAATFVQPSLMSQSVCDRKISTDVNTTRHPLTRSDLTIALPFQHASSSKTKLTTVDLRVIAKTKFADLRQQKRTRTARKKQTRTNLAKLNLRRSSDRVPDKRRSNDIVCIFHLE